MKNALNGKAGGVFGRPGRCTAGTNLDGFRCIILSLAWGSAIVPTGYADGSLCKAGNPHGATSVSYNKNAPLTEVDLAVARFQERCSVEVAVAPKAAKS